MGGKTIYGLWGSVEGRCKVKRMTPTEAQWKRFSREFRQVKANSFGYCVCFTCPDVKHWKEMDTGHFIDRRHSATKWYLLNLEVQCKKCNRYLDGNLAAYSRQLINKHGEWITEHLNTMRSLGRPLEKEEVEWLILWLREQRKAKESWPMK